jgi:CheY-like chemotaxis protein
MATPAGGAAAASRTVLVADDDDGVRHLVALVFARGARAVAQAADGTEALVLVRRLRPALAVLDLVMPGPDGIAVCRALKGDPSTAGIPVVVLTADEGAVERARAAGADAFVTKPFSPGALLALARQLLAR